MSKRLLTSAIVFLFLGIQSHATVVIYPAPSGADMATGVTVTANGQNVPLYAFPIQLPAQAGRFCQFDFSDSVTIFVSPVAAGTMVRPAFANLQPVYKNGGVEITLHKPLNVQVVGKAFIFANGIEANPPKQGDPGVVYIGPGVSSAINIASNQTIYLAGGAWVNAGINISNLSNVKIMGRGVLVGNIRTNTCDNLLINGIVQVNKATHGWSGRLVKSHDIRIINFKELGAKDYSTDGTNLDNAYNVVYDSCVWSCDDDNIAIKCFSAAPANNNITIQNCMFQNSNNCCVTLGAETHSTYSNITVRNCDFYHENRFGGPGSGAIGLQCLWGTYFKNVVYEDLWIYTTHDYTISYYIQQTEFGINGDMSLPGGVDSVTFKNIRITGTPSTKIFRFDGYGQNPVKKITNVRFENVTVDGAKVLSTSTSNPRWQMSNCENFTFSEGGATSTVPQRAYFGPTSNALRVNGSLLQIPTGCLSVQVLDCSGRIVLETTGAQSPAIDLSVLSSGIHVVRLSTRAGMTTGRIAVSSGIAHAGRRN